MKQNRIFYLYLLFALSLGLTSCLPENSTSQKQPNEQSHTSPEKQQRWQAMEKKVESWGDGLGLGIDPGIKKMVTVLNLLGFKTRQSCEGHIDWGLPYPWIDFETENKQIKDLSIKLQSVSTLIQKEESDIQKKYPDLSLGEALRKEESQDLNSLYQKMRAINENIEKTSKSQLMPLNNLIENFYKNRPTNTDRIIAVHEINPTFLRMYSLGGDWQIVRDDKEKRSKLNEYQQEMKEFTEFLTNFYFSK